MKLKKKASIHIRDVERKLFGYLFSYKVATSAQIARDVYRNVTHQALYKRLNILIKNGYLCANYHKELSGKLVYSLSKLAFSEFIRGKESLTRCQMQSGSVLHDLDLVDIGERLKGLSQVKDYQTENTLWVNQNRFTQMLRPDATVTALFPNGSVTLPIEYERTLKFRNRYDAFFKKYYANAEIGGVLLIGKDEETTARLKAIEADVVKGKEPKFFHGTLENIRGGITRFTNTRGETLVLN